MGFLKAQPQRRARASGHRVPVWVVAVLLGACTSSGTSTEDLSPSSTSGADGGTPARLTSEPLKGQIAFAHAGTSDPGHEQIYLARADGSDVRQLVRSQTGDISPALSPDGRRLVFTRHLAPEPDTIFVVNVDGTGLRRLAPSSCPALCSDAVEGPGWSPDGHTLVFTRTIVARGSTKPTNIELWLMNADTSEARRLTHESLDRPGGQPGSQDNYAGWSPDGTQVVFTHWEHGIHGNPDQFAIETVKPDGTGRRQVTPNDINAGEPAWSPDGTLIAFQSPPDDEGMIRDLYTIRPDGTEISTLTSNMDANDSDHPTWSPDSSRIVFSHVRPGSTTGADLYVVNRDGSRPHPVAATPLNETAPSWSVAPS